MEWTREENEYERHAEIERTRAVEPRAEEASRRRLRSRRRSRRRRARRIARWGAVALGVLAAVLVWHRLQGASDETTATEPPVTQAAQQTETTTVPTATPTAPVSPTPTPTTALGEAQGTIRRYAEQNGYDPAEWPEMLVELLARNPEAEEFVLHYPAEHDKTHEISLELDGSVPLYLQWDERWGYEEYSGECIAVAGCGPCCLSMAASFLLQDASCDPLTVARWAEEQGYAVVGSGSAWSLFSEGAALLGLEAVEIGADEQRVADNLAVGNLVVCLMGPGDFTEGGHFILLTDYADGYVAINDPNSPKNSEKMWCFADISDQMQVLWVLR